MYIQSTTQRSGCRESYLRSFSVFAPIPGVSPIHPETDMRTNYPKDYLERCQADMASKAGAVAIAKAVEADLSNLMNLADAEGKGGTAEEDKSAVAAAVAAVADGAAGNSGAEESKGGEGDASQQSTAATATAAGETSAAAH